MSIKEMKGYAYQERIQGITMVRLLNQLALFSALMLFLSLSSGCHHLHWGYSVPMYMQPKGFSMTYKEHLYSHPVFTDYSRASSSGLSSGSSGSGQRTKNCQECTQTPSRDINYNAERIKSLMEGEAVSARSLTPKAPQILKSQSPARIGQREAVPIKVSRVSRRF